MSKITEIKKAAIEYPGSYSVGASGRFKYQGYMVSYIAYTNPNNSTNASYINYSVDGKDFSITSHNLDIFNKEQIKQYIIND